MKANNLFLISAIVSLFGSRVFSQDFMEKSYDLSKKSTKGYFYNAVQDPETGAIEVTYKFKNKSKDEQGAYETYYFDKNLSLVKQEESAVLKSDIPDKSDYTSNIVYATVGGCTSFNILSTKLYLTKRTYEYKWNKEKKGYIRRKTEEVEIKPANDDKRAYSGYASFDDTETGKIMVLASSETKSDGKLKKDFVLLEVKPDLSSREIVLPLESSQLVYCATISNPGTETDENESSAEGDISKNDMLFVFAPSFNKNSNTDYKKYTYMRIDRNGVIKENIKFDAPSANMIVTGCGQTPDGAVVLCGSYKDIDKTFDQLYKEYSPLENPCYTGGANSRMEVYENKTEKVEMDYFSILKFNNAKLEWVKNNPIQNFEKVLRTAPGQKKASIYKGNRLKVQYFSVAANGDIFISGQLKSRIMINKVSTDTYRDVICMQFNSKGEIKAQYGIKTESISDKMNTIFQMPQMFYVSADGQNMYWNLLETKSIKGYASFFDAYYGNPTFYPNYYPSMVKINTANNQITDYKVCGDRKFLLNKKVPYIYNEKEKSIIYIGSDKGKKLWLGRYQIG
jgi:hypothetical protein